MNATLSDLMGESRISIGVSQSYRGGTALFVYELSTIYTRLVCDSTFHRILLIHTVVYLLYVDVMIEVCTRCSLTNGKRNKNMLLNTTSSILYCSFNRNK